MKKIISAHLVKLRRSHPFFATISLFLSYRFHSATNFFETDGSLITVNPGYYNQLPAPEQTGLLLHVALHTALLHTTRRGLRNEAIWNIAADIVCNNIIIDAGRFKPPGNTAIDRDYRDLSVDQVYEKLMTLHNNSPSIYQAIIDGCGNNPADSSLSETNTETDAGQMDGNKKQSKKKPVQSSGGSQFHAEQQHVLCKLYPCHRDIIPDDKINGSQSGQAENRKVSQYWQSAFRKAAAIARIAGRQQGDIPAGLLREIDIVKHPILDWRWLLWHYVVKTPSDFVGFDRRFVYRGLYIDHLEAETLSVIVAIDTSESIDEDELDQFIGELQAIRHAYPFISVLLFYVDAEVYGPYDLNYRDDIGTPKGYGGTDFSVFFEKITDSDAYRQADLVIYFTDGFGEFPRDEPETETLWIVPTGGLHSEKFPFGSVVRLSN